MLDAKVFGEVLDVFWGRLRLAVEEGCTGHFISSQLLGDLLEGNLLLCLGFEKSLRRGREIGVL